jgi:hypothetical protein
MAANLPGKDTGFVITPPEKRYVSILYPAQTNAPSKTFAAFSIQHIDCA